MYNYLLVCQEWLLGFLAHKWNRPVNNLGAIKATQETILLINGGAWGCSEEAAGDIGEIDN